MNKNYFTYLVRKYRIALIFFTVLYLALAVTPFIGGNSNAASQYIVSVGMLAGMTGMMTYILPVLLFAFVHRRRSADQFLALPLSRKEQLITILVFAFAACFGFFLIASAAIWIFYAAAAISFLRLLAFMGAAALMILSLLLVNSMWFLIANNIFDGIVMIGAYSVLPLLMLLVGNSFAYNLIAGGNNSFTSEFVTWFSPVALSFENFSALGRINSPVSFPIYNAVILLVWIAAACYGLYVHFIRRKSERAEQLSDDPLAYRLIINTYALGILLMLAFEMSRGFDRDSLFLYPLLLFIYTAAQFIYYRKIQITVKILMAFAALTAVSFGFTAIAMNTKAFGLSERYTVNSSDLLNIYYRANVDSRNPEQATDYSQPCVSISFDVHIPVNEPEKYRELTDLMDSFRRKAINDFYHSKSSSSEVTLSFANCTAAQTLYENTYSYYLSEPMRIDDLKTVSKYTEVTVSDWETGEDMTLEEYLKGN